MIKIHLTEEGLDLFSMVNWSFMIFGHKISFSILG